MNDHGADPAAADAELPPEVPDFELEVGHLGR